MAACGEQGKWLYGQKQVRGEGSGQSDGRKAVAVHLSAAPTPSFRGLQGRVKATIMGVPRKVIAHWEDTGWEVTQEGEMGGGSSHPSK